MNLVGKDTSLKPNHESLIPQIHAVEELTPQGSLSSDFHMPTVAGMHTQHIK